VDYLTIEGSFLRGMQGDLIDDQLVSAVNENGHGSGIHTVAA
jgi:EAL domain-containing protein (putative c-di-GMP-specific phosphodiesterase class I)